MIDGELQFNVPQDFGKGESYTAEVVWHQRVYFSKPQFEAYYRALGYPAEVIAEGWARMLKGQQPFEK